MFAYLLVQFTKCSCVANAATRELLICYGWSDGVCHSVNRSVCLSGVLWNNGTDDRDAIWDDGSGWPDDNFFPVGVGIPTEERNFGGKPDSAVLWM